MLLSNPFSTPRSHQRTFGLSKSPTHTRCRFNARNILSQSFLLLLCFSDFLITHRSPPRPTSRGCLRVGSSGKRKRSLLAPDTMADVLAFSVNGTRWRHERGSRILLRHCPTTVALIETQCSRIKRPTPSCESLSGSSRGSL